MFRIGEFSKLTQVSVRMLRYYDEMGLLKPAKTDKFTNYRLYSAEQMNALGRIVFLRDLGFSTAEMAELLMDWNNSFLLKQIAAKRSELETEIKEKQDRLRRIDRVEKDIFTERSKLHFNILIKSIPAAQVLSLRRVVADYYAEGELWIALSEFAEENGISISSQTFSIYHDTEYREKNVDIEICAPVARMEQNQGDFVYQLTDVMPLAACIMVQGRFTNIAGAYLAFAAWLERHNEYRMYEKNRQIVHRGPWNEENPENYLTEIQIPIEKI